MKVKKDLTITGEVKSIFKLQDFNLSLNNFEAFFDFEKKYFPRTVT